MNDFPGNNSIYTTAGPRVRLTLVCLLGAQIIMCCCSLIYVAHFYARYQIAWFDTAHIFAAAVNTAAFAIVATLFTFSQFSFGYLLGFYFTTMRFSAICGWLHFHNSTTITSSERFSVRFSRGIPSARALHHFTNQAEACPAGTSAGSSIVLHFNLGRDNPHRGRFPQFQTGQHRQYLRFSR